MIFYTESKSTYCPVSVLYLQVEEGFEWVGWCWAGIGLWATLVHLYTWYSTAWGVAVHPRDYTSTTSYPVSPLTLQTCKHQWKQVLRPWLHLYNPVYMRVPCTVWHKRSKHFRDWITELIQITAHLQHSRVSGLIFNTAVSATLMLIQLVSSEQKSCKLSMSMTLTIHHANETSAWLTNCSCMPPP